VLGIECTLIAFDSEVVEAMNGLVSLSLNESADACAVPKKVFLSDHHASETSNHDLNHPLSCFKGDALSISRYLPFLNKIIAIW
jgi:hypothetical protein